MMAKKVFVGLFGILLLLSIVPTTTATEENGLTLVILVSDNEADLTLAQKLGESMNLTILITSWGVYDPNIIAEIMSIAPDKVLIIGGPAAVPKNYEEDLDDMGIKWARIWGDDRYETNIKVLEYVFENYPEILDNSKIVIAHGRDIGALKKIKVEKAFPVYIDTNKTENQTQILAMIKVTHIVIIKTPFSENATEIMEKKIRKELKVNVTKEEVNITAEMAWEAIEIAETKTLLAKELLENESVKVPAAERLLLLAEKELENAKEAYDEGKYGKAYGQAIAAKAHAEAVIRMAGEKREIMIRTNQTLKIKIRIEKLERITTKFEKIGLNMMEERTLLEELKDAFKEGDYERAEELINQLREMIKEKFHTEKLMIREKWKEREKNKYRPGKG
ncbi:hypothetical protein E3E22_10105 [Thermococcus sp. MV5]|uniref:cell wall-binding repeat-containing protein n=1 Tax=Thermococcus sp. MV5 TaxID=1638272 RepID=UPI0014397A5C|nr:hypothetical protein [Thermococcus sp. MV5]NJE26956.1 hypothetical protein [Thermococcus sp. MV5]